MASHLGLISKFEIITMGPGSGVRRLMKGGKDSPDVLILKLAFF